MISFFRINNNIIFLIFLAIITRVIFFLIIGLFFEKDPGSDIEIYYYLADSWYTSIFSRSELLDYIQYPFFLSIILMPGLYLDQFLNESGMRIYFIIIDIFATTFLLNMRDNFRYLNNYFKNTILVFLLAPLSSIWCQEEIFSALVIILIFYFFQKIKTFHIMKILIISFTSFIFKIYFISSAFYLLIRIFFIKPTNKNNIFIAVMIFFSVLLFNAYFIQSSGYLPRNEFAISLWSLLPYIGFTDFNFMYKFSFIIFLILSILLTIIFRKKLIDDNKTIVLGFFIVHVFCLSFYHVNPEYYIFPLLGYLLFGGDLLNKTDTVLCYLVWFLSWVVNLFYFISSNFDISWFFHNFTLIIFNSISLLFLKLKGLKII